MAAIQKKSGYLRGIKGAILIPLSPDGSMPATPERHPIKTTQTAGIELEVIEGESSELRGGDMLLARVEEEDYVVGANITLTDARFDAKAAVIIGGGQLITQSDGQGGEEIIGYVAPTIEEQARGRTPFALEIYVANYNKSGGRDGWLKYTFPYCVGRAPNIEHQDREWGTPEFEIKARENPATGESVYSKEFVDTLPAELQ
ncbi:MAG TPA: hypothetical protein VIK69_12430 [Methylophilaceae bacterium]